MNSEAPVAIASPNESHAHKRVLGQFFTIANPFVSEPFIEWLEGVLKKLEERGVEARAVEPFAGANNIIAMLRDLDFDFPWAAYDIAPKNDPDENAASDVHIDQRDTIADHPQGFPLVITNPPYLAKNSASRRDLRYEGGDYEDVYQKALEVMLGNAPYVAAIIPESFITQGLFHPRLETVISLTCRMFDDTETPVCLALFCPESEKPVIDDYAIFDMDRRLGTFKELSCFIVPPRTSVPMHFNDKSGPIGLSAVDGTKNASIRFTAGEEIPASEIKPSSRARTRISLEADLNDKQVAKLIAMANKLLNERRKHTQDVFMTPFKGLRADGRYRRRLDFAQARDILNSAFEKLNLG